MPGTSIKITVDTNWLISFLIKHVVNFQLVLESPSITFYSSPEQFEEFRRKVSDEKFRKYFEVNEALAFLHNYKILATEIILTSVVTICRDSKDNYLLSLAKDAGADFLITGGKDLLVLKKFEQTQIVTLTEFVKNLKK